ncbi:MAG: DUF1385 domain-containing protein [Clostridia bacterium]|nr:DUF1385 domain-containing protein [Clostridia bacterium]
MKKTSIGGQALIEGLLMMGPENVAIAVRKSDGEIVIDTRPLPKKNKLQKIPIVRGAFGLFRQMVIGVKALMYSADFVDLEEGDSSAEPSRFEKFIDKLFGKIFGDKFKDAVIYFSVILALCFNVGLFILLPNFLADLLPFNKESTVGVICYNLFEGLIRVTLFFGYIASTSMLKDMKRIWEYHGAEHKTIHCYEHEDELTVENVRKYSTKHPRCGTSFMFTVMIISILLFSVTGWHNVWLNMLIRLSLMPLVAGISLELLKFAGRSEWKIFKIINAPGMAFQRFTTREPDDSQIEVAIAAFNNVTIRDKNSDKW